MCTVDHKNNVHASSRLKDNTVATDTVFQLQQQYFAQAHIMHTSQTM
jgi:hypothetical protein